MKTIVAVIIAVCLALPVGILAGVALSGQTYDSRKQLISCEDSILEDPYAFCAILLTYTHLNYKETYLFITRGKDGTYGETIPYPQLTPDSASRIKTVWSDAGVEFTTANSYTLFVSREKFSSGR